MQGPSAELTATRLQNDGVMFGHDAKPEQLSPSHRVDQEEGLEQQQGSESVVVGSTPVWYDSVPTRASGD